MRCAYCGQPCKVDLYGNDDYEEYNVEMVSDIDITVYIHNECLSKTLGEWFMNKIRSPQYEPQYGIQYSCVPRVTCDTACETVKITKEGE